MRKTSVRLVLAALAAAVLAGCASSPSRKLMEQHYGGHAGRSEALNVALASGLTECTEEGCTPLADLPRAELPAELRDAPSYVDRNARQYNANMYWAGATLLGASNSIGLGRFAASGLMVVEALLKPSILPHAALKPQVIAWMPKALAEDAKAAERQLEAMLQEAVRKHLPEGYALAGTPEKAIVPEGHILEYVTGPGCADPEQGPREEQCWLDVWAAKPEALDRAPGWVGVSGPVWHWRPWEPGARNVGHSATIRAEVNALMPNGILFQNHPTMYTAEDLVKLSAELPAWVYLYWPPTEATGAPLMFNQGRVLFFLEPKT